VAVVDPTDSVDHQPDSLDTQEVVGEYRTPEDFFS
jgi:hypothetical protein